MDRPPTPPERPPAPADRPPGSTEPAAWPASAAAVPRRTVAAISLESVTKRFGPLTAVDGVDLDVEAGESLVLLGRPGSGRTTLLRLVAGLETPSSGRIYLAGDEVTRRGPAARDVATVFSGGALFPHLDVEGNVGYGPAVRGLRRAEVTARVADAIELAGYDGDVRRRPADLSAAEVVRVALARALATEPVALLLDEPLDRLEADDRADLVAVLGRVRNAARTTLVHATADRDVALAVGDRIAVVNDGRFEQVAAPAAIAAHPATPFVAGILDR